MAGDHLRNRRRLENEPDGRFDEIDWWGCKRHHLGCSPRMAELRAPIANQEPVACNAGIVDVRQVCGVRGQERQGDRQEGRSEQAAFAECLRDAHDPKLARTTVLHQQLLLRRIIAFQS